MSGVTLGSGLWFKGDLYVAMYAGSVLGAFDGPINGTKLDIKASGEVKRRISSGIADFGQSKETLYMPQPTTVEFETDEVSLKLLAGMLLGSASTLTQTNSSDQTATVVLVKNQWVDTGVMNIGGVAIATLTEGTDFVVQRELGLIKALTDGAAGSKSVTYDRGAIAGDKIIGGTSNVIQFAVKVLVQNNSDGQSGILDIPKISVNPGAAMQFLGATDFQKMPFSGEINKLSGQNLFTFIPAATFTAPA